MKLQSPSFYHIKAGTKTIEVRLYDEKRRKIKLGDMIIFKQESEQSVKVEAEVIGLLRYQTFRSIANDFPASLLGHTDKDNFLKSVYSFYTKEQEVRYGVLGIRIRLTNS